MAGAIAGDSLARKAVLEWPLTARAGKNWLGYSPTSGMAQKRLGYVMKTSCFFQGAARMLGTPQTATPFGHMAQMLGG